MRVGLFADKLTRPVPTGVGAYVAHLSEALARRSGEHQLRLFSTGASSLRPGERVYGLPAYAVPGSRKLIHASWTLFNRPYIDRYVNGLDLLHVLVPSVPVPTRTREIMTLCDLTPMKFADFYSRRDRFLFERSVRAAASTAAAFIAISETTRRDAIEMLSIDPSRVHTVYCGMPPGLEPASSDDVARAYSRYGLKPPFVLFVGQITVRKNVTALLEAWREVASRIPEHRLVLAGGAGVGYDDVLARIRRWRLEGRVLMPGRVAPGDMPALLTAASALVLPSHYEGFGLPPLEAMACGTPVIVSDGGALPEVVGHAGIIVPQGSPEGLAEALLRVIDDPSMASELAKRGRARAETFSWDKAARETLRVYELVGGG